MRHAVSSTLTLLAFVFSLLSCSQGTPPTTDDDIAALLDSACALTAQSLPERGLPLLDSALNMEPSDTLRAYILAEKANELVTVGRMAEALPAARQAIALGERLGNDEVLINQYSTAGIIYRRLSMPDSALTAYRQGISVARHSGDKDYVANLYNNIAVLYVEQDRMQEGLAYTRTASKWAIEAKDSIEWLSALATEAAALLRLKRYGEAVNVVARHYNDILRVNYAPLTLKAASPMLRALVETGRLSEAKRWLQRVRPVAQSVPPTSNGALGIDEIEASLLHADHRYADELHLWQRIDTLNRANMSVPPQRVLCAMADCHEHLGNTLSALHCMRRAYAVADSVGKSGTDRQLSEFSIRLRTQEKELQITRLEKEQAEQGTRMAIAIGLLVGVVLLLGGIIVAVLARRHMARQRHQLELRRKYIEGLEGERERLARELHDGVCNDLLGLQMLMTSGQAAEAANDLRQIMANVRQISHELMPPRFTKHDITQLLSDYIGHYAVGDCKISFHFTDSVEWTTLQERKSLELYRITQELLGNITHHAHAKHITINLQLDASEITLRVENDGAQPQAENDRPGIGNQTISNRVKSLKGHLSYHVEDDRYTVLITLPKTE